MASQQSRDCSQGPCSVYCPQWCYTLFPPTPPFSLAAADDDSPSSRAFSPLVIAIIAILAAAFLLLTYYTIVSRYCARLDFLRTRRDDSSADPPASGSSHAPPPAGLGEALISRMLVYRYRRGEGLVEGSDCAVCLGEFGQGESLRLLPECGHAFHVDCIDTWLKSHSNCPVCRSGIVWAGPAPAPPEGRSEVGVVVEQASNRRS